MRKIESKIELWEDEYQTIAMTADTLIAKLEANKLYKADRIATSQCGCPNLRDKS